MTTDRIGYYVGGIIALANGSRKLDVAKARAMQLFRDADIRQREHLSVAQKVRDQLGQELNATTALHSNSSARFLSGSIVNSSGGVVARMQLRSGIHQRDELPLIDLLEYVRDALATIETLVIVVAQSRTLGGIDTRH